MGRVVSATLGVLCAGLFFAFGACDQTTTSGTQEPVRTAGFDFPLLGVSGIDIATDGGTTDGGTTDGGTDGGGPIVFNESQAAQVLLTINQGELAVAQQVQATLKDAGAKDFAQRMITEHTARNQRLTQLFQQLGITPSGSDLNTKLQGYTQQISGFLTRIAGQSNFDMYYIRTQILAHANAIAVEQSLLDVETTRLLRDETILSEDEAYAHLGLALALQKPLDVQAGFGPFGGGADGGTTDGGTTDGGTTDGGTTDGGADGGADGGDGGTADGGL